MADYLLQEDGASKFVLEDASGDILLETSIADVDPSFIGSATTLHAPTIAHTNDVDVTTAGTYSWLCPQGVTIVYAEGIGGGAAGATYGGNGAGAGGGGGAYAARQAIPVTPGTLYTLVVGAAGSADAGLGASGGSSSFTGDSGVQVVAVGGSHATNNGSGQAVVGGQGGQTASCTGDVGRVFSGGDGGAGVAAVSTGGGGGGASGNKAAAGAGGSNAGGSAGAAGGAGANGGGSGGQGGDYNSANAHAGSSPGGSGGGGGGFANGASGAAGAIKITCGFVAPFIASTTVVYSPALPIVISAPFISSATAVYAPDVPEVRAPFISSTTRLYGVFSLFDPNLTGTGPGNGGETFTLRLAPHGTSLTATLAADIGTAAIALRLTGDAGFPMANPFVATIDAEVLYLIPQGGGLYTIRGRGLGNTTPAAHTAGAGVTWGDSYDLAIAAVQPIAGSFTADIDGSGGFTYPGWLVAFDSTQAYLSGSRYPMHVTRLLGVFAAGAGSTGTNKCDAVQPNAIATAAGASDDCPAALGNPSRIQADVDAGDVAVVRYTNPEATVLDLGPRSVALQSWFGLKRVSTLDADVTFTDPNGIVVDTTGTYDTFTGSVNGEWFEPSAIGIGPDTGEPTPNPVPYTSVTLPGSDRFFTRGSGSGGFDEKGWPFGVLCVRQGNRRIPHWRSYDWHNFSYVYCGFGTDNTFAQIVVNRNGIVFGPEPTVDLPGPQDIAGPDAVWDDGTYYFGVSWYVVIFAGPYLVAGPSIGGTSPTVAGGGVIPVVGFGGGVGGAPGPPVVTVPTIEGGSGGDIGAPGGGLHVWARL